jgi:hypothetical protein
MLRAGTVHYKPFAFAICRKCAFHEFRHTLSKLLRSVKLQAHRSLARSGDVDFLCQGSHLRVGQARLACLFAISVPSPNGYQANSIPTSLPVALVPRDALRPRERVGSVPRPSLCRVALANALFSDALLQQLARCSECSLPRRRFIKSKLRATRHHLPPCRSWATYVFH